MQWLTKFGNCDLSVLQDSLLSIAYSTKDLKVDDAIIEFASHPKGYKSFELEAVDTVPYACETARILSENINVRMTQLNERFLVYKISFDAYSGGAHPSYEAKYLVFDVEKSKILSFENMFKPGNDENIFKVVEHQLCQNYYVENLDELAEKSGIFISDLFLSKNIYITAQDIVFFYNPYDIGPWAMGVVEVKVPIYELTDYLTTDMLDIYKIPY